MNPENAQWNRLTAAARGARDERDATAPYGFSTRVAALGMERRRPLASVFERFSLRALGVAALLALVCTVANYSLFNSGSSDDDVLDDDTTVSTLLDLNT